jgi:hypothetical protein
MPPNRRHVLKARPVEKRPVVILRRIVQNSLICRQLGFCFGKGNKGDPREVGGVFQSPGLRKPVLLFDEMENIPERPVITALKAFVSLIGVDGEAFMPAAERALLKMFPFHLEARFGHDESKKVDLVFDLREIRSHEIELRSL